MDYLLFFMISHFSLSVAPRINLQDKYYVGREQAASLHCRVEGNPPPTITWTPCNPEKLVCYDSFLNISKVQMSAEYTCAVENCLGRKSANTNLGKLAPATIIQRVCVHLKLIKFSFAP